MHRRAILYAVLALAVPLPALALTGNGGSSEEGTGEVPLTVSAALDSCGTAAETIVCKIDATWNQIPGANRYTASVTRADGSVVDFGDVGAGSGSFWVPYVGNGTYTVSISAYGTPPGSDHPKELAKGSASASSDASKQSFGTAEEEPGPADGTATTGDATDPASPGPPAPEPEEPTCEDPDDPPVPEEPADEPADSGKDATAGLPAAAEAALPDEAEAPESVECPPAPEPSAPATG